MQTMIIAVLVLFAQASSTSLGALEIMEKSYQVVYAAGSDIAVEVSLEIIGPGDSKQQPRRYTALRLNVGSGQEQKYYLYFHEPGKFKGMALLTWTHQDQDDYRMIYYPGADFTKRLSTRDDRNNFAESNFFYQDLTGRRPNKDIHELAETTDEFYVVTSTPNNDSFAEFDSYQTWVHRQSFVPVEIRYTKNGKVYRIVKVLEVAQIQGYTTVTKVEVTDVKRDQRSVITYDKDKVRYNIGLTGDIFTEQYLKEPPGVVRQ